MADPTPTSVLAASAAAEVLDRLALQYQGVLDAAITLRSIGQLDNAIAERRKTADALQAQIDASKTELAEIEAAQVRARGEMADELEQQRAALTKLADETHAAALAKAAAATKRGEEQAVAREQLANDRLAAAQRQADMLAEQNTKLRQRAEQLAADAAQAEANLQAIDVRLRAAQEAARKILGGDVVEPIPAPAPADVARDEPPVEVRKP